MWNHTTYPPRPVPKLQIKRKRAKNAKNIRAKTTVTTGDSSVPPSDPSRYRPRSPKMIDLPSTTTLKKHTCLGFPILVMQGTMAMRTTINSLSVREHQMHNKVGGWVSSRERIRKRDETLA
uniref:Uncharacterized protein n=1 Tax=Cannabis sativa TaxID=3483 RepID=A0A803NK50_CANSA